MEIEARKVEYVKVHIDRRATLSAILTDMLLLCDDPKLLQAVDTIESYIDILPSED